MEHPRTSSNGYGRILRLVLIDGLIIAAAYTAAFSVRAVTAPLDYLQSFAYIIIVAWIIITTLYVFGVYRRIWSHTSGHGIIVIINAVILASLVITVIMLPFNPRPIPLSVVYVGNILALMGFTAVRYRSRLISGLSWRWRVIWLRQLPKASTRVLIIGAGESGQELAWRIKHRFPRNNYRIIGFIDDDPAKQGMYVESCMVLGDRHDLVRIADAEKIDLIVVAVHNISGADFRDILTICENTQAMIKVIPDVFELVNDHHRGAFLRDVQPEDLIGRTSVSRHKDIDFTPVTGKTILITGAAGSIGSELSRQVMLYEPARVVLVDNNESGLHDLHIELNTRFPMVKIVATLADISIMESLERVFRQHQPQIVFHAAAYKHVDMMEYYPQEAVRVNIGGTLNLARLAQAHAVQRFVLISSDKAVNPIGVMGASKRACELLLHALCLDESCSTLFTSVRFGNVLGSRGSIIPTFNRQIDNGGPVTVTHPEMTRYFMSIPEAVNLIIHAACLTKGDDIFILRMGEKVRIVELAERMIRLRGLRPGRDITIDYTGIRPGEKLHEELYSASERPTETRHPGIIQLNTWRDDFDSAAFFKHLRRLLAGDLGDDPQALERLRAVIDSSNDDLPDAQPQSQPQSEDAPIYK